jgi:hypothetical protein
MKDGTAMAGGQMTDMGGAHKVSRPGYHEMEGRAGNHITLPYASPQAGTKFGAVRRPPTGGLSAIVPYNYTIVDTKTLGGSLRSRTPGRTQEP